MTKCFSFYNYIVILTLSVCTCGEIEKAIQLLTYNETSELFQLRDDALNQISSLKQPVQVVSGVGDARIGKSTSLNFIRSHWMNPNGGQFEEVFPTSDSFERCTQGIWISTVELKYGSVLLMDVEGTDLGNDAVTDHLSIFTALMSSGMVVFARDTITNHVIDFLYRVSRLSELIFKESEKTLENFPRLRIALRTQLNPPSREKLREFVLDALIGPNHRDGLDKNREKIATHFPEDHIEASLVPYVSDSNSFKDYESLKKIGYVEGMRHLTEQLKKFPSKKTLGGGLMDGFHLKLLAVKLADAMNEESWLEFGNVYLNVEKHVCAGSYEKFVRPLLNETADAIEHVKKETLRMFDEGCALEGIRNQTRKELQKTIADKRRFERLQIKLNEEKRNLQKAVQDRIELEKKHEQEMSEKDREFDKERTKTKELNETLKAMRDEHEQVLARIHELKSQVKHLSRALDKAKSNDGGLFGFITGAIAGLTMAAIPSDIHLKQNITNLASSEFQCLGLRGVEWAWGEAANQFGLTGSGRGLIAQEVEKQYPEAVETGNDGYKRVRYGLLWTYKRFLCG